MLDYVRTTPPLSAECQALAQRMLSLSKNIPGELEGKNGQSNISVSKENENREEENKKDMNNDNKNANSSDTEIFKNLKQHEVHDLLPSSALTQLTVNEYSPGQGIAQHIGHSLPDMILTSFLSFFIAIVSVIVPLIVTISAIFFVFLTWCCSFI